MLKYAISVIAALAFGLGAYSVARHTPREAHAEPPAPPPQTAFAESIGAVGLIEPRSENVAISPPLPGLVTQVFVKVGDRVKAGQPLFALDDRDAQAELAVRENEVTTAAARIEQAQAAYQDALVQLDLIESVTDRRAIREEDLKRRRIAADAAKARLAETRAQLKLAGSIVARVRTDIARLTVSAPIDGEVLQLNVRAGEYASVAAPAKPLLVLGDTSHLHLRADIAEEDAPRFSPQAMAAAAPRGAAALRVPLQLVRVEPYVVPKRNLTGDSAERVDTRVLQVVYRIDGQDRNLHVGQQMDVFIETASAAVPSR